MSLPYLNAFANTITVSGYSAGCFTSHLMAITNSSTIKGAGLFACWPYGDYDGISDRSASNVAKASLATIEENEKNNKIDPTSNI